MFHDTSVLINFHRAGLLHALGALLGGDVAWVGTVRAECERKELDLSLPALTSSADAILGEPLRPVGAEHLRVRRQREMMAAPGDHPDEHLGEAETITLIDMRAIHAMIATDDKSVARFAGSTPVANTWQLARTCFSGGYVSLEEVTTLWRLFGEAGGTWPREINTAEKFMRFLLRK